MAHQFHDRYEAGRLLADTFASYERKDVIVYGLPRGGVIPGAVVAEQLHVPLDLIFARKVGHPLNSEYAICAVTEDGEAVCNHREAATIDKQWLDNAIEAQRAEAKRRRLKYFTNRSPEVAKGKTAIIVDDGVATGLTIRAAIEAVRNREPDTIVLGLPVIPADMMHELHPLVDDIVALQSPVAFLGAIGAYYDKFEQIEDEEVISILAKFR